MSSSKSRSYQTQKTCRSKTAYPVPPDPYTLAELTVAYVHRLANEAVHTAASGAAAHSSVSLNFCDKSALDDLYMGSVVSADYDTVQIFDGESHIGESRESDDALYLHVRSAVPPS